MQRIKTLRAILFINIGFIIIKKREYIITNNCIEFNYTQKKKKIAIYILLIYAIMYLKFN